MPNSQKVMLLELLEHAIIEGTSADSYAIVEMGPILEDLGPQIEDIVMHVQVHQVSGTLSVKTALATSYDGLIWDRTDIEEEASLTTGYHIQTAYNTRTSFGRKLRFEFGVKGLETATVSVTAAIRLYN